jgi:hypothetical protein
MPLLRRAFRWAHILAGVWLSVFVFSPLRLDPAATIVAQVTIIGMVVSGLAIWQWPRLMKLSSRWRSS